MSFIDASETQTLVYAINMPIIKYPFDNIAISGPICPF
jgi:hypothetical protein